MLIFSQDAEYQVLYRRQEATDFELLICQNRKEAADMEYTLLYFFQKEDVRRLVEKNRIKQEITGNFVDFKESFLWKDGLVMVFLRRMGTPLHYWLKKDPAPLSLRLEIGKRLLERLLLLNMPEYLLCNILIPDCILVTDALEVAMNYEPKEMLWTEGEFPNLLRNRFYQIFILLFQKEEQEHSSPEIHGFLERFRQEPYEDVFRIYQMYDWMQTELAGRSDINQLKPRTWLFRLQTLGIRGLQVVEKLAVPVIVLVGMILTIYLVCNPVQEEAEEKVIEQIGTLKIR